MGHQQQVGPVTLSFALRLVLPRLIAGAARGRGRQRHGAGKEATGSGAQPGGSKKGGTQPGGQKKCGAQPVQGNDGDGRKYIVCRRCKKQKEVGPDISKKVHTMFTVKGDGLTYLQDK